MSTLIRFAAVLLLIALSAGASADERSVYVGRILEVSRSRIELDQGRSIISIGFFAEPEILDGLSTFKVGDEVRAVFGSGIPPGGKRPINRLLGIRLCVINDRTCIADRQAAEAQAAISEKARAADDAQHAECDRAMDETLSKDARYAPSSDSIGPVSDGLLSQVRAFRGAQRICSDRIMADQQAAVYDACVLHHCGDHIGGGCDHIASYGLTDGAFERAVLACKDK